MLKVIQHRESAIANKHVPAGSKQQNHGAPLTAEEIVKLYYTNGKKLGVPDMRRYMKTLVADVFLQEKFSYIHKCRGIWKQTPSDWDPKIPFADPNNAMDNGSNKKPCKKTLKQMLDYLVGAFENKKAQKKQATFFKMQPMEEEIQAIQSILPTTEQGNIWAQSSDADVQMKLEAEIYGDMPEYAVPTNQAQFSATHLGVHEETNVGVALEESSSWPNEDPVQELSDDTDIVKFVNGDEPLSHGYEEGGAHDSCYNVQVKNESMEVARGAVPVARPVEFPPAAMNQPPPPNPNVNGMMVSDVGQLARNLGSVFLGGGEGESTDDGNLDSFSGQINNDNLLFVPDLDCENLFDSILLTDELGNCYPLTGSLMPMSNVMEEGEQQMITQPQQYASMEGQSFQPEMESGAQVLNIPTTVTELESD